MSSFFNMDSPIMRFLSRVCDLIILNLLTIVCCIPVFTAGASITALFSVTLKMVKGEESYIVRGFFKGFKENFKQSTIIWLIIAVLGFFLFMDYRAAVFLPGNMRFSWKEAHSCSRLSATKSCATSATVPALSISPSGIWTWCAWGWGCMASIRATTPSCITSAR